MSSVCGEIRPFHFMVCTYSSTCVRASRRQGQASSGTDTHAAHRWRWRLLCCVIYKEYSCNLQCSTWVVFSKHLLIPPLPDMSILHFLIALFFQHPCAYLVRTYTTQHRYGQWGCWWWGGQWVRREDAPHTDSRRLPHAAREAQATSSPRTGTHTLTLWHARTHSHALTRTGTRSLIFLP